MQVPLVIRRQSPSRPGILLRFGFFANAWLALHCAVTSAQLAPFELEVPPRAELTPARLDTIPGPTTARLKQAAALASDKNWIEAINAYRDLLNVASQQVVAIDEDRYVSLRTYCHMQLAKLPTEGLAAYRHTIDPLAARWYQEAIEDRDETKLQRLVNEFFCSSWGDDALFALGEMALERSDFAAARRAWEQISPQLRDPRGLPLWIALRDVDLGANWPQIEKRWTLRPQPPTWLAYPDTSLDLAAVRARLILVSIRAGELDRAALEIDVFRRLHPAAVGRLGGKMGPYVAALDHLLSTARDWPAPPANPDWPTFAGSQTRCSQAPPIGPIIGPTWAQPAPLPAIATTRSFRSEPALGAADAFGNRSDSAQPSDVAPRESDQPIVCFPSVAGNIVAFNDGRQIRAVELATGRPAITEDGILYHEGELISAPRQPADFNMLARSFASYGIARGTVNALDGVLYSRVGMFAADFNGSGRGLYDDRLIGIDLARDGLITFQAKPPDGSWAFDGTPVGDGLNLWVAMRRRDVMPHAYVACYDAASGAQIWRTSIAAADTPAAGAGHENTHNLLTLVGGRIYFNTNLGLIAALDAHTGEICWLHQYQRAGGGFPGTFNSPLYFDRDPSSCLYHNGLLVVAPADTPAVFALDADTGRRVWNNDRMANALHLLGVVKQNLAVSGNRLWVLDIRSGRERFAWPESEHAGIRGMGRGVIAGDEIFWPARDAIYVLHALTGQRTRSPLKPRGINYRGANLAVAHNHLLLATHENLIALGEHPPTNN